MEYTVDELLTQRKNILQELDDISNSSARCGCDCGCGGGSADDYEESLMEELHDVEYGLTLRGV